MEGGPLLPLGAARAAACSGAAGHTRPW